MAETSLRLLRLLALLQSRRTWGAPELAARLDVTTRTIRKDVDRLRRLGYPVDARPGVAGGYRLGTGAGLPPLFLDDDEAIAVAVGLRTAAGGTVAGIEEASLRALAKVQQVFPARLRRKVKTFETYALRVPPPEAAIQVSRLAAIADACRDHERFRFGYRAHDGTVTDRDVEPYRLVHDRRRWYLFAWDTDRADWRTFRADRITPRAPAGPRFAPRSLPPDPEITARVADGVHTATWRYRARVVVHAPAQYVRDRIPVPVEVREVAADRCEFTPGSDHPEMLALYLGMLDADFTVVDGPELAAALTRLADRCRRAVGPPSSPDRG
ncbi:YafY family protein [Actinoplanes sp. NPDC024001]|uniref:helix-turn-helix transcriptional regulator n=1 Tax=Actinoplanes sp. NPDC024001 TaxID=3154598 RepID=UPI0033EC623A